MKLTTWLRWLIGLGVFFGIGLLFQRLLRGDEESFGLILAGLIFVGLAIAPRYLLGTGAQFESAAVVSTPIGLIILGLLTIAVGVVNHLLRNEILAFALVFGLGGLPAAWWQERARQRRYAQRRAVRESVEHSS